MLINKLSESGRIEEIYGNDPETVSYQRARIERCINGYREHFGDSSDLHIFSAAGRSEIGGNHTDHQRGHVLAASLNIDSLAIAAAVEKPVITLYSEG